MLSDTAREKPFANPLAHTHTEFCESHSPSKNKQTRTLNATNLFACLRHYIKKLIYLN